MNFQVIPQSERIKEEKSKRALCVTGAAFSGRRRRYQNPQSADRSQRCHGTLVNRSVSFHNSTRRKTVENDGYYDCTGGENNEQVLNSKACDLHRACKSAQVSATDSSLSSAKKRKELKRSKSDVSLKQNRNLSLAKSAVDNNNVGDSRSSPNVFKRKESFTRGDIISDQCEQAVDTVKRLSKFKMDVKVGVRNDHYNQWARSKRSVSLSLSPYTIRGEQSNQKSPPNSARMQDVQHRRSLAIPRKGSATKHSVGILNFENFNTIFNDIPAEKPRVPTNKSTSPRVVKVVDGSSSSESEKVADPCKKTNILQIDGIRCINVEDKVRQNIAIPRISVGNVLECASSYTNTAMNKLENQEKLNGHCEGRNLKSKDKSLKSDNFLTTNTAKKDSGEIEAVFEANSVYLNVPEHFENGTTSSDDEFDRIPLIDGKAVNKTCDTEIAKEHTDDRKTTNMTKTTLIPVKQDIFSKFEVEAENNVRFVIRNDLYRLSKVVGNFKDTKQRVDSAINRHEQSFSDDKINIKPSQKDSKVTKIPLKVATNSPILSTQSLENNFAKLRIEQHLQNLKMRTESQLSARNSPFKCTNADSAVPSGEGRSGCENGNFNKQTCISLNEQVSFNPRHSFGHLQNVSVKIKCSAKNIDKLRNSNKIGEIIPLRRLSIGRKIWKLNSII